MGRLVEPSRTPVEAARAAVEKLFADRSVSQGTTKARLADLRDHIAVLMESLDVGDDDEGTPSDEE